jgi:hypothetical protein
MLVQDQLGEFFVFELSPDGYTCTPYRDRIYRSHAASIVLLPLESTAYEHDSIKYRERVYQEVQRVIAEENQPYEPFEIVKGCVAKCLSEKNQDSTSSKKIAETSLEHKYPYSPSIQIIVQILQNSTDIKIQFEHEQHGQHGSGSGIGGLLPLEKATPENMFNRNLKIIMNTPTLNTTTMTTMTAAEDAQATQNTTILGATTIIRDM